MTKNQKMSFETICEKVQDGCYMATWSPLPVSYPPTHIFDSKKSVDWNGAKFREACEARSAALAANRSADASKAAELRVDVIHALGNEYGLNDKQAELVFARAYEDKHPFGYYEVMTAAQSLARFAEQLLCA